eukprot:CAMPEP_0196767558 /NCGR_PEP_ID=MMETSP1095-20130614/41744_1 /TAXON_ID=96789 ORGANISM="Chromulina nebulosa, Strain UTEXLB2642" /NCGR_SAMPLE_ID=MMETSP1095 /ASSEMBLY_ACC=CAM_ASM_000446 /LENGTH=280 /DNA_ID=CAMNT_0042136003 /DNA_START=1261 /DNA_END=2104 /DNA_ORIENTATION=-
MDLTQAELDILSYSYDDTSGSSGGSSSGGSSTDDGSYGSSGGSTDDGSYGSSGGSTDDGSYYGSSGGGTDDGSYYSYNYGPFGNYGPYGSYYGFENITTSYSYSYDYGGDIPTSYAYSPSITSTDDFVPFQQTCYDNGLIFQFAHAAALIRYNDTTNGDLFVVNRAYRALTDTILNNYDDITESFDILCSGSIIEDQMIPPGCALLAVEFYGGDDRHLSEYYYQPSTIAFTNNIFLSYAMKQILTNPPTRLVQLYYDCVLSPVSAFFTSTGLAFVMHRYM